MTEENNSKKDLNELLLVAAFDGDLILIEQFLQMGADINARLSKTKSTPLLVAILANNKNCEDTVNFLLKKGADPNIKGKDNTTPLMIAVLKNNKNIVKILLDHNADPKVKSLKGKTPAEFAEIYNFFEIEDLIIAYENKMTKAFNAFDPDQFLEQLKKEDKDKDKNSDGHSEDDTPDKKTPPPKPKGP